MTKDDEDGGVEHVQVRVDDGGDSVHVITTVGGEGGFVHTDIATVDERDAKDKRVDGGDVQDLVAGDGDVRTQVPLDEGGGTDAIQADTGVT